jgi:ADP-heptose:LPS heptosyltransferase
MKTKYFLCVKGYGDFTILIYAATNSTNRVIVFASSHLKDLALCLNLPKRVKVIYVPEITASSLLYHLKSDYALVDLLKQIYLLRSIALRLKKRGKNLLLDIRNIRNCIFFLGCGALYYPKQKNIYTSYQKLFGLSEYRYTPQVSGGRVCILPEASNSSRTLSKLEMDDLIHSLARLKITCVVALYQGNQTLQQFSSERVNHKIYKNFNELVDIITDANILITVDSLPLHIGFSLNKSLYVLSDAWKYFIPEQLVLSGRIFPRSQIQLLCNKVYEEYKS